MFKISFGGWIANPAARFTGNYGAVTERAEQAGCSRQSVYDHADKVLAAVEAEHGGGPTREQLIRENAALRRENAELWEWLFQTIEFPLLKQQQFAVTAFAMGLSLNQVGVLLALLLGTRATPSRSSVHRWIQAAAKAAGPVLKRLDHAAKTLVLVGCLDEIFFHRKPVLVGVEPKSMMGFLGKKADDHQGSTWFAELQPWTWLGFVTSDAGLGLKAGIAQMQRHRRQTHQVPLEKGLDVFHTKQAARRVLRILWNRVERLWEQAEAATRAVEQAQRQGRHCGGLVTKANAAWKKASQAFRQYEQGEAGWKQAEPALNVFGPDGRLNDRSWAATASRPGLAPVVRPALVQGTRSSPSQGVICRFRSERAPLFRSSGDHLSGCGANRLQASGMRSEETVVVSNAEAGSFAATDSGGPDRHLSGLRAHSAGLASRAGRAR